MSVQVLCPGVCEPQHPLPSRSEVRRRHPVPHTLPPQWQHSTGSHPTDGLQSERRNPYSDYFQDS